MEIKNIKVFPSLKEMKFLGVQGKKGDTVFPNVKGRRRSAKIIKLCVNKKLVGYLWLDSLHKNLNIEIPNEEDLKIKIDY